MSYKSVYFRYMDFRYKIFWYLKYEFERLGGEIEIDESYFGGKRKAARNSFGFNFSAVVCVARSNNISLSLWERVPRAKGEGRVRVLSRIFFG